MNLADVLDGDLRGAIVQGDCMDIAPWLPAGSVDLVFTSPPYEDARQYGIAFGLRGKDWVKWAANRYVACAMACKGLNAWVINGRTRKFRYSNVDAHLRVALEDAGLCMRKPPIYMRHGIPGSGGPDWLKDCYEPIVCATLRPGRLPWSDNTACGHTPKYKPGGEPSHRTRSGCRVNMLRTKRMPDGTMAVRGYVPPEKANPGNVIECKVGGGKIGDKMAHENEAPFPERLAEFFIKSFCPPGGIVLDPFIGGGTTAKVAARLGRRCIGIDCRASQVDLTRRRLTAAGLADGFWFYEAGDSDGKDDAGAVPGCVQAERR